MVENLSPLSSKSSSIAALLDDLAGSEDIYCRLTLRFFRLDELLDTAAALLLL